MKKNVITSWEEYKKSIGDVKSNVYNNYVQLENDVHAKYDVVYIVALDDEMDHLLSAFNMDDTNYKEYAGLKLISFCHDIDNKVLNIAILKPCGMGLVPATMVAAQAISVLKPALVVMTGVCAALEGRADYGDVILFDHVYLHDEGKLTATGLQPEIRPIAVSRKVSETFDEVIRNDRAIGAIAKRWPERMTRREPLVAMRGIAASGMAVIADEQAILEKVCHQRKLLALDMESYAIAYCASNMPNECDWAIIKSVQDNGDGNKNDKYRHYASYTSARCSLLFLESYFSSKK